MKAARLPAAALAVAVGALALGTAPAALAVSPSGSPSPAPALSQAARLAVGGPDLGGTGVVVNYPAAGGPRLPKIPASAWVIADASTGQVLAAKDPHGEFQPASTLKVLTAITLIPLLNPNALVTASTLATSVQPNIVGLLPGRQYKVADLFRALLLISANDAAVALTQATGSFTKGMALINAEAHRLQAYDVVAKQPNGLPAAGQVVSAYDEALIARQALATPAFMSYDSTLSAEFPVKPGHLVGLANQNTLLTQYKGGLGGKIGWTEAAGATYIGMARRGDTTLIVTVLHCTPLQEITSGEQLLNWGFAMDGKVAPVGTLVAPLPSASSVRAAAARQARADRARAAQISSQAEARASDDDAGLAVAVGILIAGAVGLTLLARSRRREAQAMFPPRPPDGAV
jgi:D-alanyl-D-alanine carboxypeptidase (penicillin-binding protein 5/6)